MEKVSPSKYFFIKILLFQAIYTICISYLISNFQCQNDSNGLGWESFVEPKCDLKNMVGEEVQIQLKKFQQEGSLALPPESSKINRVVCPDVFKGNKYGYPYYHTGFVTENCGGVKPLSALITIFINYLHSNSYSKLHISRVLKGIRSNYSDVPIVVAVPTDVTKDVVKIIKKYKATLTKFNKTVHEGTILNSLHTGIVKTPYVLIARDLNHFSWFSPLDRSLRILTEIKNVSVVAGAFRNKTGYWKIGCYQTEAKFYGLRYLEGYHRSTHECMFCDHVSGSFVTSLETMTNFTFSEKMPSKLIYANWFMKLRLVKRKIMACPDVMYFQSAEDIIESVPEKKAWNSLAKEWSFDLIKTPLGRIEYECDEVNIVCSKFKEEIMKRYARPPCCAKLVGIAMGEWQRFADKHNLVAELDSGFALGGVKMSGMSPYDSDGDLDYLIQNHTYIYKRRKELDSKKVGTRSWKTPVYNKSLEKYTKEGYFSMQAGGVNIEMYTVNKTTYEQFLPEELKQDYTKVKFNGAWVSAPANPGMFGRNRYGYDCLKHAQSYWMNNITYSFAPYEIPKAFIKCDNPKHHSCLDKFEVDGNIQFQRNY